MAAGIQSAGSYLTANANLTICQSVLGFAATAQYGLSLQLLGIITGMAAVWTQVKWQLIGQQRAQHDYDAIQRTYWPRMWLQYLTFFAMAAGMLALGHPLLHWLKSGKQLLPWPWLGILTLNAFLDMQLTAWGTLIATDNRVPYLWASVVANVGCFALSLILIHATSLWSGCFGPEPPGGPMYFQLLVLATLRRAQHSQPPGHDLFFPGLRAV